MATLPPKSTAKSGSVRLGDIPLLVEEVDYPTSTLVGTNLRNGAQTSIRLANAVEIAELYMDRSKVPTEDARLVKARQSIERRPDAGTLRGKLAGGLEGQIIQMQGVRKSPNDDLISRWAKPITSDLDKDIALRAYIEITAVQSKSNEWRKANILVPREAQPATADTLRENMKNQMHGMDGTLSDGITQSRNLISMTDSTGNAESAFIYTKYVKAEQRFLEGEDAVKALNVTNYNHRVMGALAGRTGLDLVKMPGFNALSDDMQDTASLIREMAADGGLDVVITPGYSVNILKEQTSRILASEQGTGRSGPLTGRGYFEADIAIRTYSKPDGSFTDGRVKEIVETGPLLHPDNANFHRMDRDSVGNRSFGVVENMPDGKSRMHENLNATEAKQTAENQQQRQPEEQPSGMTLDI